MKRITFKLYHLLIIFSIAVIFIITPFYSASADVVSLTDGSVMNGKLIYNTKNEITFVNSYGTFKISKLKIIKLEETSSYEEDINIKSRMGLQVDRESIKKDYLAGEAEKEKKEFKKTYKRISLAGFGISTFGILKSELPYGYGGAIDYDHNLLRNYDDIRLPWLRLDGAYTLYKKNTTKVTGYTVSAGPMWLVPIITNPELKLVLSVLPGISFLDIQKKITDYKATSNTFTINSIAGIEIPFGSFALAIMGRYTYIYDKDASLQNIGCSAGLSFSF